MLGACLIKFFPLKKIFFSKAIIFFLVYRLFNQQRVIHVTVVVPCISSQACAAG
jgi:hypothetical protein